MADARRPRYSCSAVPRMQSGHEMTSEVTSSPAVAATVDASGALAPVAARDRQERRLRGLVKTLRPHQWVKNLFVLAPMFFHKDVFVQRRRRGPALNLTVTGRAFAATGVFCLLAGAVYTINDIVDVEADRVHPVKRFRPIASGAVPEGIAKALAARARRLARSASRTSSRRRSRSSPRVYFAENIAYSFKLKKVAFLDVGLIAFGFVLRVARRRHRDRRARARGTCSRARRCSRSSSASASAGTSSRSRTRASSAPPSRRTRPRRSTSALARHRHRDGADLRRLHARLGHARLLPLELPLADGPLHGVRHRALPACSSTARRGAA